VFTKARSGTANVPQPTDITRTQYTKCRLCSDSWGWASNARNSRGPWFSINWMKCESRWFHYTEILWCTFSETLRMHIIISCFNYIYIWQNKYLSCSNNTQTMSWKGQLFTPDTYPFVTTQPVIADFAGGANSTQDRILGILTCGWPESCYLLHTTLDYPAFHTDEWNEGMRAKCLFWKYISISRILWIFVAFTKGFLSLRIISFNVIWHNMLNLVVWNLHGNTELEWYRPKRRDIIKMYLTEEGWIGTEEIQHSNTDRMVK
jgi:hypothetical protein